MKRIITIILLVILCSLSACAAGAQIEPSTESENQPTNFDPKISILVEKKFEEPERIYYDMIYVGDSRFVGMSYVVPDQKFIAKCGIGYYWLEQQLGELENRYKDNSVIVIGLGVNDLGNVDKYISLANELSEKYRIVFLSVNPVDEIVEAQVGYSIKNSQIEAFNQKLQDELSDSIIYLDTYTYLMEDGFSTVDGLHYSVDTYLKLFDYINNYSLIF